MVPERQAMNQEPVAPGAKDDKGAARLGHDRDSAEVGCARRVLVPQPLKALCTRKVGTLGARWQVIEMRVARSGAKNRTERQ